MTSFDMANKRFYESMRKIDAEALAESLYLSYDDYPMYYEKKKEPESGGAYEVELMPSEKPSSQKKPNKIVELAVRIFSSIMRLIQDFKTMVSEMFTKKDDLTFDAYRNTRDVQIQLNYDIARTQHNARINFLKGKKLVQRLAKVGKKSDEEVAEYVNQWNKWLKVHGTTAMIQTGVVLKLKKDSGLFERMGNDMKEILHLISSTSAKDPESAKMMYQVYRVMAGYCKEFNQCSFDLHQRFYSMGAPVKKPKQKIFRRRVQ